MNKTSDLKRAAREALEAHIDSFAGEIKIVPIGVSGEVQSYKKPASKEKLKAQRFERNAKRLNSKKRIVSKSEVMKKVIGHSRGNDGFMLFLECGHQKQSAVKEVGKIPITSKCFCCLKPKGL